MFYWLVYYLTKVISWLFFPYTTSGRENLPRQGACILACNHVSNLDPVLMGIVVPRRISFMAKDSLFRNPVLGWCLRHLDAFPIKRGEGDVRSLREALRRLKSGQPLLLFPQGTRSQGHLPRAHSGTGFLIAKSTVPVVPVFISGSEQVLPPGAKWFRRHPIRIIIGPPVRYPAQHDYEQIATGVMEAIFALAGDSPAG